MTEIEKLYSLAGVEKKLYCDICKAREHSLGLCAETKCDVFYPPFTAVKQIQLILFMLNTFRQDFNCRVEDVKINLDTLAKGVAQEVINCWQDLTSAEQNEIRRILE